jgi:hypothetical protein
MEKQTGEVNRYAHNYSIKSNRKDLEMKKLVMNIIFIITTAWAQLPVFHTSGRFLLDPCGDTVIIRGVELPVNQIEYIPEVAKSGANFVRILISIPPASYPTPASDLETMLKLVKGSGMAADVSLNNNAADGSAFVVPEYMAVLKRYEDIITLHAQGEGKQSTAAQWVTDAESAITKIRTAGYRCPLYILSTTSGRDPYTVLKYGKQLIDYDPLHNILCGVQLYWGYTWNGAAGWYIGDYQLTDKQAIDTFAVQKFPIVAGINNHDPYGDPWLDYETQLSETEAHKISWFWWDWYNPFDQSGKYHLSTTGKYGDWGICAAGAPDLDKFTVSVNGTSAVTYEAENYSSIAGTGWGKISYSSVSGGQFLCCSGKSIPDWAEWNKIDGGASGGKSTLTITYNNGDEHFNQPLKVVLNGDTAGTLTCGYSGPGASDKNFWRVWKDDSITITLKPGMNTLRLVSVAKTGFFKPEYGEQVCVSHPASILHTSKKTSYMIQHSCKGGPSYSHMSITNKNQKDIRVFSSSSGLNLKMQGFNKNALISVFDIRGAIVYKNVNSENNIRVSNLRKGMYVINVKQCNLLFTKKALVK